MRPFLVGQLTKERERQGQGQWGQIQVEWAFRNYCTYVQRGEVWGVVEFINCSLRMLMTRKLTIVGASAYTLRTPGGNHLPVATAVGVGLFEIFVFFCFCWCFSRFFFFIFALPWYSKRRVVALRNCCGLWVCEWVRKRKRAAFVNTALTNFALFLHFQL